jgi:hypothetical protein
MRRASSTTSDFIRSGLLSLLLMLYRPSLSS